MNKANNKDKYQEIQFTNLTDTALSITGPTGTPHRASFSDLVNH